MDDPDSFDLLQATGQELTAAERAKLKRRLDQLVKVMHEQLSRDMDYPAGKQPPPANS